MPMIPFVKSGYYASRNWIPLVNGNGDGETDASESEESVNEDEEENDDA